MNKQINKLSMLVVTLLTLCVLVPAKAADAEMVAMFQEICRVIEQFKATLGVDEVITVEQVKQLLDDGGYTRRIAEADYIDLSGLNKVAGVALELDDPTRITSLIHMNLLDADFTNADLRGVDFTGSLLPDLDGLNFDDADLTGAILPVVPAAVEEEYDSL